MKKLYFLVIAICVLNGLRAQNPADVDPDFNQFNLPLNHYFVDAQVNKSKVLSDGKIILIKNGRYLVRLQGNQIDTSFNTGIGFANSNGSDGILKDFAVQPDGKIIIGGIFNLYNGVTVPRLIRLNQNGSLDESFNLQGVSLKNEGVIQIEIQADNKIIIIADETNIGGFFDNLKRLNSNGSLDTSLITVPNYRFGKVAIQADGKYVVIHNTNNDFYSQVNKIAKLNADGSFDTSFSTAQLSSSSDIYVKKILIQNDGKIVVGGSFTGCNSTSSRDLVRLNSNGLVDTSFQIGYGFDESSSYNLDSVSDIIQQSDSKLVVSGSFMTFNQLNRVNIVRLNGNGSNDDTFVNLYSFLDFDTISSVSFFSDQKILVSGSLGVNKKLGNYIVKINTDGTKDTSFSNISKGFFNTVVNTVVQITDGKILVGGNFHAYNGSKCYGFTRLNYDGSVDSTLTYGGLNGFEDNSSNKTNSNIGEITAIEPVSNGKVYIGGRFSTYNGQKANRLVRINVDGTNDSTFNVGEGIDYGYSSPGIIKDLLALPDGSVLVAGAFSIYNGANCYGVLALNSSGGRLGFPDVGNDVTCLKTQNDGKVLIGLSHLGSGNYSIGAIKRFNLDSWSFDTSFVIDPSLSGGSVTSIEVQQDNKIILSGEFVISGVTKSLVRILSNGTLDTSFNFTLQNNSTLVRNITLAPNQKIIIDLASGSLYFPVHTIMRLNSDGSVDNTFNQFIPSGNSSVNVYSQTDGKILIYGNLSNSIENPGAGLNRLLGEDYNFMQGQNKIDSNSNGCDINDDAFTNLKLRVSSGANSFNYITNTTGNYNAALINGTHTITPILENPTYFNVSPNTVTVSFPTQASPFTQNFCIVPNGIHPDLEVTLLPLQPARPGFDSNYKIVYKNKGNTMQSGVVNLTFNDGVLDFVVANPLASIQTANNLSWNFTNLRPFETREIEFTLNVNSPTETPAVNSGFVLVYKAAITSSATDETSIDNTFDFNQTVVNSFDPNDKTCLEGTIISPDLIGQYVHYMIRFENNGTYSAQNIVVKDMIDLSKFDISTLIPTSASHSYTTKISEGNKVEFIFENINLPFDDANNDGYIAFKIKTLPTLAVNDTFTNDASIFFDYNFPVVTNKAASTFKTLTTQDFEFSNYFTLYPNPAKSVLNISSKETIEVESISFYNTLGQLVLVIPNAEKVSKIDVSSLTAGNYFIKINSDKGTSNTRFIKE
ncbi:T9SS type A sorting domain-containing protein [Flavobacterium sp. AED]|uniref:DUF7619 domain-containing protein n=1 Tax=Flavobacterium sp. AED TaxID=1423323 RepID=UPI00068DC24C|nr:T9SS type A sorting domain-containing protein [Flavobacterium sp. AED]